jgi:K+-transporting ATPase ATPase C chain
MNMKNAMRMLKPALISFAVMTVLCGVIYTVAVTGIAQLIFPIRPTAV